MNKKYRQLYEDFLKEKEVSIEKEPDSPKDKTKKTKKSVVIVNPEYKGVYYGNY